MDSRNDVSFPEIAQNTTVFHDFNSQYLVSCDLRTTGKKRKKNRFLTRTEEEVDDEVARMDRTDVSFGPTTDK